MRTVDLCARRIREGHDPSRQIDARLLIVALSLLVRAAAMEAAAIEQEDAAVRDRLEQARARFDELVPGLSDARNVLTHFDEYARGHGRLQRGDNDRAAAARHFWGFGYDPANGNIVLGPYQIDVEQAVVQAHQLFTALYAAAQAVDRSRAAP